MTEDEAKEKWCPFPTGINTLVAGHKCWASECMTWVWDTHPDYLDEYNPEARGHCGMVNHCSMVK